MLSVLIDIFPRSESYLHGMVLIQYDYFRDVYRHRSVNPDLNGQARCGDSWLEFLTTGYFFSPSLPHMGISQRVDLMHAQLVIECFFSEPVSRPSL